MSVPADLSVTELAELIGLSRRIVSRRVKLGTIPSMRPSGKERGHRRIAIEVVRAMFPTAYEELAYRHDHRESAHID